MSVITRRVEKDSGMWQVFHPFEDSLWLSILLAATLGGLIMVLLNRLHRGPGFLGKHDLSDRDERERQKVAFCQDVVYQLYRAPPLIYHACAALLGGDEYDLYHDPPLGRVYRLGLLFLVLVVQNTYTANLAAFLTASPVQIMGPKNMQQLRSARCCARWEMNAPWVRDML